MILLASFRDKPEIKSMSILLKYLSAGLLFYFVFIAITNNKSKENKSQINKETGHALWNFNEKKSAMSSCMAPGNPKDYCECYVSVLENQFTYSDFAALEVMLKSGAKPSGEILSKMKNMQAQAQQSCGLPSPIR